MAIELANGVTLPDFPEGVFDVYKYGVIAAVTEGENTTYYFMATAYPCAFVPLEIATEIGIDNAETGGLVSLGRGLIDYEFSGNGANWEKLPEVPQARAECPLGNGAELLWTNYDVFIATAYNATTDEITVGTEIYFANSEVIEYIATSTEFKTVADKIRSKGGTTASMEWPDGFAAAIEAIQAGGGEVKRAEGTLKWSLAETAEATVSCGFKPDLVFLTDGGSSDSDDGTALFHAALAFTEDARTGDYLVTMTPSANQEENVDYYAIYGKQTDDGFYIYVSSIRDGVGYVQYGLTLNYVAVNYSDLSGSGSGGSGSSDLPLAEEVLFG